MERNLRVNYKEFTNCLRITIVPDCTQDERIEDVKNYCIKYGFKNVMLFFNAEEYNVGHITKEELLPWIATIKKAKRILESAGISVGLNPWIEMGQLDRGKTLKEGQNFVTMVDMYGKRCGMVTCPWDEEWRKYYFDLLAWYLQEVNPDVVWIEDDFRLHNHAPLTYGGCFCELHMQRFNEKLGTQYSREEFVAKVFAVGEPTPERKAFLEVNRETMLDISEKIGEKIQELGLKTRVGLMSSMPQMHCFELRDWHGVQKNLSAGEELIDRIHLPCYEERCAKDYYREFNTISMVVRALLPDDTYIYPELENGSFSNYTKDSRFLRFQLESTIPMLPVGMTYDIYDFVGNGTVASFGYGEEVRSVTKYMQGVMDLGLRFSDMYGLCIPIDECASKYKEIKSGWQDLTYYQDMEIGAYFSGLGINCRWRTDKEIEGETVVLTDGAVRNFSDEQLKTLFEKNYIVADGSAVLALQKRGLNGLLGVKSAKLCPADTNLQAYEQAVEGFIVEGKRFYRAGSLANGGDYVKIEYDVPVTVYTNTYTSEREYFGIGGVKTDKFAVIPYVLEGKLYGQYNPLRRAFIFEVLRAHQKGFVQTEFCAVNPYTYKKGEDSVLMLINSTVTSYDKISFATDIPFKKLYALLKNGKMKKIPFKRVEGKVVVSLPLAYLSTQTLVLKA